MAMPGLWLCLGYVAAFGHGPNIPRLAPLPTLKLAADKGKAEKNGCRSKSSKCSSER
jgi:hypothetical protein